jgi:hypothetical protein
MGAIRPSSRRLTARAQSLLTSLASVAALAVTLGCRTDVINGWPVGHAVLQGSVLRRGDVPYDGTLFVTCAENAASFRTSAPGQYRIELSWTFPAGIPADSVECDVRAGQPSFAATRRVPFVPLDVAAAPLTLDVIEP